MLLTLERFYHIPDHASLGLMFVDSKFQCFTLEDAPHPEKIQDKTRIPAGLYDIDLRHEGSVNARYAAKYPFHVGMLWLRKVPNYEWVYIHVGNTEDHTSGCILVGEISNMQQGVIGRSVVAYTALYQRCQLAAQNNDLKIHIIDRDML